MNNKEKALGSYADVNGLRMYYEIHGKGQPIILLHGAGSTIYTTFGRIMGELAETRKIIGIELQAHGHTSDRNADLSFEQDADDVAELMRQLDITNADVLGFSNGANTALQLAIRHPERVRRVIAGSPLLKKDGAYPQFWEFMSNATLEQMPAEFKTAFLEITGDSVALQNMHDKCVKRMLTIKDFKDEDLKSIKAQVMLINGDKDVATSEHLVQMSRVIPSCKLAIIPGGHGEYLGEITTLKPNQTEYEIMPILDKFFAN